MSLFWCAYNCIGPYLLLQYTFGNRDFGLRRASSAAMLLSSIILVGALVSVWIFYPTSYDLKEVRSRPPSLGAAIFRDHAL